MKSHELHRLLKDAGWIATRQSGSHVISEKDGKKLTVPDHGAKEIRKGLISKILKTIQ